MSQSDALVLDIIQQDAPGLLGDWLAELKARGTGADHRITEAELHEQGAELLRLLGPALSSGTDVNAEPWRPVREFLERVSRSRATQGFSSTETATFVFSLKRPLFTRAQARATDAATKGEATWTITELVDRLGLYTVGAFQKSREEVIVRQQEEMLELSTPVVKLWEGVVALPMIGTLDSARTQVVMESLLQSIVETGSEIAIIDITGVPTVDTLVAQHLLKTVTAIRLMGAECIISGIRPQIAQTIVHLGIDLEGVTTKATLADALSLAFKRSGLVVTRAKAV
ncbi:MAG: STAS domain-containing protein [Vicinamibacteraceae bacterium]